MGFFSGDFGGSGDLSDPTSEANAMATLAAERALSPSGTSGGYLSASADVARATGEGGVSTRSPTGVPFVQPQQSFIGPVNRTPLVGGSVAGQDAMLALQQHIEDAINFDPSNPSAGSQIAGFLTNLFLSQTPLAPAAGGLSEGLVSAMNRAPNIETDLGMRMVGDELGLGYSKDPVDLMGVSGREPRGEAFQELSPLAAAALNLNYQSPTAAITEPTADISQWESLLPSLRIRGKSLADILSEGDFNYGG